MHLMTGPKGNSEFCFSKTLNVPWGEAEGNVEVEGKQNSLFPAKPVITCFVRPLYSKIEKNCEEVICLRPTGSQNLLRFQGACPDHLWVGSSSCCFFKELVSFVRPRELVSFDPRHVSRSPPMGKHIWVRRYYKIANNPCFCMLQEPSLFYSQSLLL